MFALYTAPAINLFEKTTDRIAVKSNQHEYHVIPDRSRYLEFEPHRILDVYAHFPGGQGQGAGPPALFGAVEDAADGERLFYTVRRLPRRRTAEEKTLRRTIRLYRHRHVHLAASSPAGIDGEAAVAELSVRALCSNRHLTEHLAGRRRAAPTSACLTIPRSIVVCVAGPTPPREPIVSQLRSRSETAHTGTVTWRLINMLSLNHLGLVERGAGKNGAVAARNAVAVRRPVRQRHRTQDPRHPQRR